MNYQVSVSTGNLYDVSVNVKKPPATFLRQLDDVETETAQNNYVMVYNQATNTYKFISPGKILDLADGVEDGALDYGTY
jgi:hypothetical protein